jgi:class 3 adenylate cyclase/pimeloyl-ACP methyl ester carboxylesterase
MRDWDVRYAKCGDIDIAWTMVGDGPLDIVYVPGFISHLDLCRELPFANAILGRLGRIGRVLTFDKRGTGLSGRELGFGSVAERADDIRAVMDAAGWERANFLGISEGGPLSLLFAASYPERVDKLALYGTFASFSFSTERGSTVEALVGDEDPFEVIVNSWGTGEVLGFFIHAPRNDAALEFLARYERACASPSMVREIMHRNAEIAIHYALPTISAPALVIHRTNDPLIDVRDARALAEGLHEATLIELDGVMHCGWNEQEWAPALDAIEEFFTGTAPAVTDSDRVLATILFTDIVDSTGAAANAGDHVWRTILDRHDAETSRIVDRHGGRVVKRIGDGMLAAFESPARAVHCARAVRDALAIGSIDIRCALHTGEVERRGDDLGGIGVHIAARINGLAHSGEILVSRTVRDLVSGSDLRFEDRGEFQLKGVPEAWHLYSLRP